MNEGDNIVQLPPIPGNADRADWNVVREAFDAGVSYRQMATMPEAGGLTAQALHHHIRNLGWIRDESPSARIRARQDVAFFSEQEARQARERAKRGRQTPSGVTLPEPKKRGRPKLSPLLNPMAQSGVEKASQAAAGRVPSRERSPGREPPQLRVVPVMTGDEIDRLFDAEDAADDGNSKTILERLRDAPAVAVPERAIPEPEEDPVPPADEKTLSPSEIQSRTMTRVGVRQQRRLSRLHDMHRTLLHAFEMLSTLATDDPDFAYFAGKYLGPKDSLTDLARKVAQVNGMLQREERIAFDMEAARPEDLEPFVPKLGRRASPVAHINPYRNGELGSEPVSPSPVEDEPEGDEETVGDAAG